MCHLFLNCFLNVQMKKIILPLVLLVFNLPSAFTQQKLVDSLLTEVAKNRRDTGTVIAYRALAGLSMNTDPVKGIAYAWEGVRLGQKISYDKGVAGCFLNMSTNYNALGKPDSSLIFNDSAIHYSKKVGEPARIGLVYLNRADLKVQLENFREALVLSDSAMKYAEIAKRSDLKARVFHVRGNMYFTQSNYAQSRYFYGKAHDLYAENQNYRMMAIIVNNLGNTDKHLKNYDLAITDFKKALDYARQAGDEVSRPMYYSNLSDVYVHKGDLKAAEENALISLRLAKELSNEQQILNARAILAYIYLKTRRPSAAITEASETLKLATGNRVTDKVQVAADILGEAYAALGQYKEAWEYTRQSKTLSDSLNRQRYEEDVLTMQTNFELREKENEIELLAKENELHQQKLRQNRLLMAGSAIIALLAIGSIFLLINRSRARQRIKELELRNHIASDLHDEVGSSLSSIHLLSQMIRNQPESTKRSELFETMSRNVKETVDRITDIVWVVKPEENEKGNLRERMERFAYDICSSAGVELDLNISDIRKDTLTMEQRKNLYLIFKEAVNNAVKYSGTEKLRVELTQTGKEILLNVEDQGRGFDPENVKKGNGLNNIRNRSKELNAGLEILSREGEGTRISLSVTVN